MYINTRIIDHTNTHTKITRVHLLYVFIKIKLFHYFSALFVCSPDTRYHTWLLRLRLEKIVGEIPTVLSRAFWTRVIITGRHACCLLLRNFTLLIYFSPSITLNFYVLYYLFNYSPSSPILEILIVIFFPNLMNLFNILFCHSRKYNLQIIIN